MSKNITLIFKYGIFCYNITMKAPAFKEFTNQLDTVTTDGFIFEWQVNDPRERIVGLLIDGKVVGLVKFSREFSSRYNRIESIEVMKEYQGQGYGAMLMAFVMMDSFSNDGFEGFVALTSKSDGTENFYLHLGAKQRTKQLMIFDTEASQYVVSKYLPNGGIFK
ncbi:GNAT family N-acetyltransferase [Lentilactobacillus kisonensis]|nr:GNAT family N-acetyltransferase [Lentilactobacillus kisonensis]